MNTKLQAPQCLPCCQKTVWRRTLLGTAWIFLLRYSHVEARKKGRTRVLAQQDRQQIDLDFFLSQRTGGGGVSSSGIWSYEGILMDPTDGTEICQVEGIELVRQLPSSSSPQKDDGGLQIHALLKSAFPPTPPSNAGMPPQLSSTTLLSRKLFIYHTSRAPLNESRALQQKEPPQRRELLRSIRLRPTSPERVIPLDQSVICYDTATTFVEQKHNEDESHETERKVFVHSEFPDGRCYGGETKLDIEANRNSRRDSILRFSVNIFKSMYDGQRGQLKQRRLGNAESETRETRRSISSHHQRSIQRLRDFFQEPSSDSKDSKGDSGGRLSGKQVQRSKWIEFGTSSSTRQLQNYHKLRARETYEYHVLPPQQSGSEWNINAPRLQRIFDRFRPSVGKQSKPFANDGFGNTNQSKMHVQYTRYGEAPPWLNPSGSGNRWLQLQLKGRRIDTIEDAPHLVASIAATKLKPGFMVVDAPVTVPPSQAIRWFREDPCGLLSSSSSFDASHAGGTIYAWMGGVRQTAQVVFERIRKASRLRSRASGTGDKSFD